MKQLLPGLVAVALLTAPSASQGDPAFTKTQLQLSTGTPDAFGDVIVFRLNVKVPDGIWLMNNATGERGGDPVNEFAYCGLGYVSMSSDQTPLQENWWATSGGWDCTHSYFTGQQYEHFPMGTYVMVLVLDNELIPPDNNVVTGSPTTFSNAQVDLACVGFKTSPVGVNPISTNPPWASSGDLQDGDMIGHFPYTWISNPFYFPTHPGGGSGMSFRAGGNTAASMPHSANSVSWRGFPVTNSVFGMTGVGDQRIRFSPQYGFDLASDTTVAFLALDLSRWDLWWGVQLVDLGLLLPPMFPNGGALRLRRYVTIPGTGSGTTWDFDFTTPVHPALIGASVDYQGLFFTAIGTARISDLFGMYITF